MSEQSSSATVFVFREGKSTGISCDVALEGRAGALVETLISALDLPRDAPCTLTDTATGRTVEPDDDLCALAARTSAAAAAEDGPQQLQLFLDIHSPAEIEIKPPVPARPAKAAKPIEEELVAAHTPTEATGSDATRASAAAAHKTSQTRRTQNAVAMVQQNQKQLGLMAAKKAAGALLPDLVFDNALKAAQVSLLDDYTANLPYGVHVGRPCIDQLRTLLVRYNKRGASTSGVISFDPFRVALARGNVLESCSGEFSAFGTYHFTFDELAAGVWYPYVVPEGQARSNWVHRHSARRHHAACRAAGTEQCPDVFESRAVLCCTLTALQTQEEANKSIGPACFLVHRRTYQIAPPLKQQRHKGAAGGVRIAVLFVNPEQLERRHEDALAVVLTRLNDMGFTDDALNASLLSYYNGDISRVLEHLTLNKPPPSPSPVGSLLPKVL